MNKQKSERMVRNIISGFVRLRRKQGLTQSFLAKRAQVTRPALSLIESGKRKPSLDVSIRIADGLKIKLSSLLLREEKKL